MARFRRRFERCSPQLREMRIMMRHWIMRLSFLAMLLLAAGAGKKWQ